MTTEQQAPLVSVRVLTYNHEKYIVQCLEGILMQRTDFPFEIVVGEDCSTDRTREIALQYQQKYPEKIKLVLSPTNLGASENSRRIDAVCQGKYHAICEGDDYWIDPLKLQKQVNYMESHPDVTFCFHNAFMVRDESPETIPQYYCDPNLPQELGVSDVVARMRLSPSASILLRAEIFNTLPQWRTEVRYVDLLVRLWAAHHGKLAYLNETMSVYRIHAGGTIMANASIERHYDTILDILMRFDAETKGQYTALIQQASQTYRQQAQQAALHKKLGKWFYLFYPGKIFSRWQHNKDILRRYTRMFSR